MTCQFWDCSETIPKNHFLCPNHYPDYSAGAIDKCRSCGQYKKIEDEICKTCSDEALLEELRSMRRNLAREHRLQEFFVFSNKSLDEMVEKRPVTPEAMLAISGVGAAKMKGFGRDFLQVIQQYAGMNAGRQSAQPTPPSNTVQRDDREFAADKDADRFFVYVLLMNDGDYYIGQTRELLERLHEHRNNMTQSTKGREPKLQWFTTVQTRKEAADLEAELQRLNSNPAGRREIIRWVVDFEKLVAELDFDPHKSSVRERPTPFGGVAPPSSRRSR